jgi:hypothetical protein
MSTTDSPRGASPDAVDPEEASVLNALRAWGAMPIEAPDLITQASTRRAVVGNMARIIREEQVRRGRRKRRAVIVLTAMAAVLILASTALALVATRETVRKSSNAAPGLEQAVEKAVVPSHFPTVLPSSTLVDVSPAPQASTPVQTASASPSAADPVAALHASRPLPTEPSSRLAEPPNASELAEQNRLFLSAMSARRQGNDAETVRDCDELLARYPSSPLAPEARAERASAAARLKNAP